MGISKSVLQYPQNQSFNIFLKYNCVCLKHSYVCLKYNHLCLKHYHSFVQYKIFDLRLFYPAMTLKEAYPKIYLYRRIVQAKMFIDQHYHEDINLADIADKALFSKFHFTRLFKSIYGKTPHQYLISVRIDHAKILFQTNMSVADVCYEVGFGSVSSFSVLFSKIVGQSPSAYQANQHKWLRAIVDAPLKFIPNCFAEKKGWLKNSNFQEVYYFHFSESCDFFIKK